MNRDRQRALTLIEMLTVLILLVIAFNMSVPSVQKLINTNRSQAIHDQLKASLHLARTHSVNQGKRVEICGSSQATYCDHAWHLGWLVREQGNSRVIQVVSLPQREHLIWNGFSRPIRFQPSGHSKYSNGTFTFCGHNAAPKWQIILNRQGRPRTAKPDQLRASACEKIDRPS